MRVGGRPILDRIVAALHAQCDPLVINANGDAARFAAPRLPVVADSVADHPGPLAGILAGLDWTAAHHPEASSIVTAPTDTPFLPADLVERLTAARGDRHATIACASSGGAMHPVIALWPVALRHHLRIALVDEGVRKVGLFLARHEVVHADWPIEPYDPFFNVNTPAEVAAAEAIALALER